MDKAGLIKLLEATKDVMHENRDYLIQLDSVIGDGDLGLTMEGGFAAAYDAVKETAEADFGKILYFAGKAMAQAVPSTMGTLMASGLMNAGKVLKGTSELSTEGIYKLYQAYMDGVAARGGAKLGEKTFLDGINPAVEALKASAEAGASEAEAAAAALAGAEKGFDETTHMLAKHGRMALRGELSATLEDPGAAVALLLMKALVASVG